MEMRHVGKLFGIGPKLCIPLGYSFDGGSSTVSNGCGGEFLQFVCFKGIIIIINKFTISVGIFIVAAKYLELEMKCRSSGKCE